MSATARCHSQFFRVIDDPFIHFTLSLDGGSPHHLGLHSNGDGHSGPFSNVDITFYKSSSCLIDERSGSQLNNVRVLSPCLFSHFLSKFSKKMSVFARTVPGFFVMSTFESRDWV